ncbi:ACR3 family arsenite efflux transporter [Arthrobacter sp. S1_S22]|nr:ACR3 family arsenite efflux transporter [Arthrobacter sp. S1_S22]
MTFIDIAGNTSYIDFHQSITEQRRRPVSTRTEIPPTQGEEAVVGKLSTLDRFLPVWIIAAMALGLLLGNLVPGLNIALEAVKVGEVSLPIAAGLLVMMYPVLAKVRYDQTRRVIGDRKLMISSLVINWLLAPAFMFVLAWVFLADLPEYRTGLIIVGLARCIAMVMIWNDLACGDRESAAVLVAINSVFQVVAFGALGWFYLQLLPSWLGLPTTSADFSFWAITLSVLIFLGIPLLAGFLTRTLGEKAKGRDWYEGTFLPKLGPWALYGLLFTITLLFALQGETITARPLDVARIALPLLVYFVVVFGAGMLIGKWLDLGYAKTTTLAFTAAGNNFELAIAVAIGTFGVTSGQALAGVVGPLIEVPALVALVYAALWARKRFFTPATASL